MRKDEERENRIVMEIVVDAYNEEERAMGWYSYLEEKLKFPFTAECCKHREISPLVNGEQVEVVGLASEDECGHEMFVEIDWEDRSVAVPLAQLTPVKANKRTVEAVGDWHYWMHQGYEF